MRARIDTIKLTNTINDISNEIDQLERVFKKEKKACFEEIFIEYTLGESSNKEDVNKEKMEYIERIQRSIENNMNHLVHKQIIMNQIYMAKSKARIGDITQVIGMQQEAIDDLHDLRDGIKSELNKIIKMRKAFKHR